MVKLNYAAAETRTLDGKTWHILRGVIDSSSLEEINIADYQRGECSVAKTEKIAKAFQTTVLPDIFLGMQGSNVRKMGPNTFQLMGKTSVIDGRQRLCGAIKAMGDKPGFEPSVGCMVISETSFNWEKEQFTTFNLERTKVSPNIIIYNERKESPSVGVLYALCANKAFPAYNRVTWKQTTREHDLFSCTAMLKTAAILHHKFGASAGSNVRPMIQQLDAMLATTWGMSTPRLVEYALKSLEINVWGFFLIIEKCFKLSDVEYVKKAPQVKVIFLSALADFINRYDNFWNNKVLHIEDDVVEKLAKFPLRDPDIEACIGGAGGANARKLVRRYFVDHMSRGRGRINLRLNEKYQLPMPAGED